VATDVPLLHITGKSRHTVTEYWHLTSKWYSILVTEVTQLHCTNNWLHIVTVYWQLTSLRLKCTGN